MSIKFGSYNLLSSITLLKLEKKNQRYIIYQKTCWAVLDFHGLDINIRIHQSLTLESKIITQSPDDLF